MDITEEEFYRVLSIFDTRITTINDRTKNHTSEIRQLKKQTKNFYIKIGEKIKKKFCSFSPITCDNIAQCNNCKFINDALGDFK